MDVVGSRLVSSVVSGAAVVLVGCALAGPAAASQEAPGFDPSIAEQQAEPDTATVTTGEGCVQNPVICQSGVAGAGGGSLPRTGPQQDRLLATGAVGAGLLLAGAGAVVAGRRRTTA